MAPATSSPLNTMWLRLRGRNRWLPATATLDTREWVADQGSDKSSPSPLGHWHVEYSYTVAGERFTGRFADFASEDDEYLKPGQHFEIRYNPRKPAQSYYPKLQTQLPFLVLFVAMGVVLAALLLVVLLGEMRAAH